MIIVVIPKSSEASIFPGVTIFISSNVKLVENASYQATDPKLCGSPVVVVVVVIIVVSSSL